MTTDSNSEFSEDSGTDYPKVPKVGTVAIEGSLLNVYIIVFLYSESIYFFADEKVLKSAEKGIGN